MLYVDPITRGEMDPKAIRTLATIWELTIPAEGAGAPHRLGGTLQGIPGPVRGGQSDPETAPVLVLPSGRSSSSGLDLGSGADMLELHMPKVKAKSNVDRDYWVILVVFADGEGLPLRA